MRHMPLIVICAMATGLSIYTGDFDFMWLLDGEVAKHPDLPENNK